MFLKKRGKEDERDLDIIEKEDLKLDDFMK